MVKARIFRLAVSGEYCLFKFLLACNFAQGMIMSSHLWGYIADTRGRRKTLIASLVLDAICGLASSLAHTYWLFAVLRFFNGFL